MPNPPKLDRNYKIVMLRRKDPKKWSWETLRVKFKFKSRGTVKQIFDTFNSRFK